MPASITLKNLSKRYGGKTAVDSVSLEVQSGEVLGLLGPNGAGKTTVLSMIAGLVQPTTGSVQLFGKDLNRHYVETARRRGVMMERPSFYRHLSAQRNLELLARLAGVPANVDRALDLAGLLDVAGTRVGRLSFGMRQRLGLAQAMLTEPELLILDEPTTGLDVEATQDVLNLLGRIAEEAGVTILFSSHLMREVERLCDRVAVLKQGRLIACEETDALLSYDKNRVTVLMEGAEGAAKRLVEQPWVRSVEAYRGRLEVQLREENVHQLNNFLVQAGYQISGLIPKRRTLKEYFLRLVNQQESAGDPPLPGGDAP